MYHINETESCQHAMCRLTGWDVSDGLGAGKPCMCLVPSPNDIIGVMVVVGHMLTGYTT